MSRGQRLVLLSLANLENENVSHPKENCYFISSHDSSKENCDSVSLHNSNNNITCNDDDEIDRACETVLQNLEFFRQDFPESEKENLHSGDLNVPLVFTNANEILANEPLLFDQSQLGPNNQSNGVQVNKLNSDLVSDCRRAADHVQICNNSDNVEVFENMQGKFYFLKKQLL